jgi:hypothetical protein
VESSGYVGVESAWKVRGDVGMESSGYVGMKVRGMWAWKVQCRYVGKGLNG